MVPPAARDPLAARVVLFVRVVRVALFVRFVPPVRALRVRARASSGRVPEVVTRKKCALSTPAVVDHAAGTSGGPVSPAQRAAGLASYRDLARAAAAAAR